MHFFKTNEKPLIKSLIYGFIGGGYIGVLFLPREKLVPNPLGKRFYINSAFEHILSILKISVSVSLIVFILSIIFLYLNNKKDR